MLRVNIESTRGTRHLQQVADIAILNTGEGYAQGSKRYTKYLVELRDEKGSTFQTHVWHDPDLGYLPLVARALASQVD